MLPEAVRSFYRECKAFVKLDRQESGWFQVKKGLQQGCVMIPWLFNEFMNIVVWKVERGVSKQQVGGEVAQEVIQLLSADDTALVTDLSTKLQLTSEFGRNEGGQVSCDVSLNGKWT